MSSEGPAVRRKQLFHQNDLSYHNLTNVAQQTSPKWQLQRLIISK